MSLTAKDMLGTHNIDIVSLSNPEIASFGNTSNGAYFRWYDSNNPNQNNSFLVGIQNSSFNIVKENTTQVGIGTTLVLNNANLQVQGTLMTSNIATYNPNDILFFNNQNIGGISNLYFTGTLFQGTSPFKTSQWDTLSGQNAITYDGNVGIGTTVVSSKLYVDGDVVVTGALTALSYAETSQDRARYSVFDLYNTDANGYKTVTTNDASATNRVLYTFSVDVGRYMLSAVLPYKNLTEFITLDTLNWAMIGLYKTTLANFTNSMQPSQFTQIRGIGSANADEIDEVTISWFIDVTERSDFVIVVSGKGHSLQFGPHYQPSDKKTTSLFLVPVRAIGTDDDVSVRNSLQVKPAKKIYTQSESSLSLYTVTADGYYDVFSSNIDIFILRGNSIVAKAEHDTHFTFSTAFSSSTNLTTVTIIPRPGAPFTVGDKWDTTVWLTVQADSYFKSGYLYQKINISSAPWQAVVGGGVKLNERCVIQGDLYVEGSIYGGCNTTSFQGGGIIADFDLVKSSNIIGTINIADRAVTTPKLDLTQGNIGIGTNSALAKLHVLQTDAGDALRIDDEASDITRFMVNQDGNVGIGTDTALKLLHVNGSVLTNGVVENRYHNNAYLSLNSYLDSTVWRKYTSSEPGYIVRGSTNGLEFIGQPSATATLSNATMIPLVTMQHGTSSSVIGNVGIGTQSPLYRLHVQATGAVSVPDAGVGHYIIKSIVRSSLGTTAGNYLDLCTSTCTNGAYVVHLDVVQSVAGSSISKSYIIPVRNSTTNSSYFTCLPVSSSGVDGNNDWNILINVNTATATFRLVRVSGTTQGTYTCIFRIAESSGTRVTITEVTTSGTGLTSAGIYASTVMSQVNGNVGIGTTLPSQRLHVDGNSLASRYVIGTSGSETQVSVGWTDNTGLFRTPANNVGVAVAGTERCTFNSQGVSTLNVTASQQFFGNVASVQLPAYSFTNDNDTGILNPNANELAIVTGATQRMVVNANGNVGIGTTTVRTTLDIVGNSSENVSMRIQNTGTGYTSLQIGGGTNDLFISKLNQNAIIPGTSLTGINGSGDAIIRNQGSNIYFQNEKLYINPDGVLVDLTQPYVSVFLATPTDGTTFASNITTTDTIVKFTSLHFDTRNSYNKIDGLFTAPLKGIYYVTCKMLFNTATTKTCIITFNRNGVRLIKSGLSALCTVGTTQSTILTAQGMVSLNAGDTLSVLTSGVIFLRQYSDSNPNDHNSLNIMYLGVVPSLAAST